MDRLQKFLLKFYQGVSTPRALQAAMLVKAGEWGELQKLTTRPPSSYLNAEAYRLDAWVVDLTRKLALPGDQQKRTKAAINTFYAAEEQCCVTNARLNKFIRNQGPFEDPADERVIAFIKQWRKELKRVLGRAPYLLEPRFSGGSTLSDQGKLITIPDKMSSCPTAYAGTNLEHARDCFLFTPIGEKEWFEVRSNRFFTVLKNADEDRGCCVEASVNVQLQLAVGVHMKRRHKIAYKADLRHLQQTHRTLARKASARLLDLVTIDLSKASDTVARKLIELVAPMDWHVLLNSLRAKTTVIDGKTVYLEKFSSMGNGFTFELETLLFRSLCETISGGSGICSVYGDDIIVEARHAPAVLAALAYFGFTPNAKKTFCEGPFRESCGGDFFDGEAVRPHYLKELPDEPQKWIGLANGLRRIDPYLTKLHAAWRYCVDQVPVSIRVFGPEELGDLVFYDPSATPTFRKYKTSCVERFKDRAGFVRYRQVFTENSQAYFWRVYRPVGRTYDIGKYWSYRVATAAGSLGVKSQVTTRDDIVGYKLDWVPVHGLQDHTWWCGSSGSRLSWEDTPWGPS